METHTLTHISSGLSLCLELPSLALDFTFTYCQLQKIVSNFHLEVKLQKEKEKKAKHCTQLLVRPHFPLMMMTHSTRVGG